MHLCSETFHILGIKERFWSGIRTLELIWMLRLLSTLKTLTTLRSFSPLTVNSIVESL